MIADRVLLEVSRVQVRENESHSPWLRKKVKTLNEIREKLAQWDSLSKDDRFFFYRLAVADDELAPRTLGEHVSYFGYTISMALRTLADRGEVAKYYGMLYALHCDVRQRVAHDRWREALADAVFVAKAEAGRRQIDAGQAIKYPDGK